MHDPDHVRALIDSLPAPEHHRGCEHELLLDPIVSTCTLAFLWDIPRAGVGVRERLRALGYPEDKHNEIMKSVARLTDEVNR